MNCNRNYSIAHTIGSFLNAPINLIATSNKNSKYYLLFLNAPINLIAASNTNSKYN